MAEYKLDYTGDEIAALLGSVGNKLSLSPTALTSGVDLNDLTTVGYYRSTSTVTATLSNVPDGYTSAFSLVVRKGISAAYTIQELYASANNGYYQRRYGSKGWTDWVMMATTDDLDTLRNSIFTDYTKLTADNDLDAVTDPGVYYWTSTDTPSNIPDFAYKIFWLDVESKRGAIVQTVNYFLTGVASSVSRYYTASSATWSDWVYNGLAAVPTMRNGDDLNDLPVNSVTLYESYKANADKDDIDVLNLPDDHIYFGLVATFGKTANDETSQIFVQHTNHSKTVKDIFGESTPQECRFWVRQRSAGNGWGKWVDLSNSRTVKGIATDTEVTDCDKIYTHGKYYLQNTENVTNAPFLPCCLDVEYIGVPGDPDTLLSIRQVGTTLSGDKMAYRRFTVANGWSDWSVYDLSSLKIT